MADKVRTEPIVEKVDPLQGLPWKGNAMDIDPSEDAWERGAPPTPATYKVQLALQECEFVKYDPKDESRWGYNINIEGRIQGGEFENVPVFLRVSTFINRGKKTSTAIGALIKLGYKDKLPANPTPSWVATNLSKIVAKGPMADWEIDWRAGFKDASNGGKWKTVASTYSSFPDSPHGGKMHTFVVTATGGGKEEVSAQLTVANWIGKGEEPKAKAKAAGVAAEDLDLEEEAPKATGKLGKAAPKAVEEDELDLT